jgi:hypothetical protein
MAEGRDAAGRFDAGNFGRPKGAKGRRPTLQRALDDLVANDAEGIIRIVVGTAKAGDMRAAEIILKRLWPEPRGRLLNADMPEFAATNDLAGKIAAVIAAVANGSMTPEEGRDLVALVEAQRRAIETVEVEQRLQAVERVLAERK